MLNGSQKSLYEFKDLLDPKSKEKVLRITLERDQSLRLKFKGSTDSDLNSLNSWQLLKRSEHVSERSKMQLNSGIDKNKS